jgi:hypothetical protein
VNGDARERSSMLTISWRCLCRWASDKVGGGDAIGRVESKCLVVKITPRRLRYVML